MKNRYLLLKGSVAEVTVVKLSLLIPTGSFILEGKFWDDTEFEFKA
ncbi:hypothetical protein V4V35_05440 [Bacillus infantis]